MGKEEGYDYLFEMWVSDACLQEHEVLPKLRKAYGKRKGNRMRKEDFKRIPELRQEIARALNLWENAIESATRKTSVITGMPRSTTVSSQVETAVVKAEVYKEKYDELCEEQRDIYKRLRMESLDKLTEQESDVLQKAYPQGKKTEEIAKEMHLTERHIYRLKKQAINKLCI